MLFEKITEDEIRIIEKLRRHPAEENASDFFKGNFVDTETFLRHWEYYKTPLAQVFKDSLILKKPVKIQLPDAVLEQKILEIFYQTAFIDFKYSIYAYIERLNKENWNNPIEGNVYSINEIFSYHIFNEQNWLLNCYNGPVFTIKISPNKTIKVSPGIKIIKLLQKIVKEYNDPVVEDTFETIRIQHSQILNEAKIESTLCISIHPLDYMTASVNNNDWTSCMNWYDGEYRRGVIEMMNSPCVIVAYIESKSQELEWYDGGDKYLTWNSKKWREFFIVNNQMICGIKGYPYWNKELEKITIQWLAELFNSINYGNYGNKIYEWVYDSDAGIFDDERNISVNFVIECGPAMYNDFSRSDTHQIAVAENIQKENGGQKTVFLDYSGPSECVCCGDIIYDFGDEESLFCNSCNDHYYCCHCSDNIYTSADLYEHNDRYYCSDCYYNLPECDICGEKIDPDYDENTFKFVIGKNDTTEKKVIKFKNITRDPWTGESDSPIVHHCCANCANDIFVLGIDELHKSHHYYKHWFYHLPIVPINRIKKSSLEILFDSEELTDFIEA